MTYSSRTFDAVLFDLDGTLYDSAPDLTACANRLRTRRNLQALPIDPLRAIAGRGAQALITAVLGIDYHHPNYHAVQEEFLTDYQLHCLNASSLFNGVLPVLQTLKAQQVRLGIVTNKHARFVFPILKATGLDQYCSCVICGDDPGLPKPAPDHLLLAIESLKSVASRTLYVGDDERDALAAKSAGLPFAAACYGYLGDQPDITRWSPDISLNSLTSLLLYFE